MSPCPTGTSGKDHSMLVRGGYRIRQFHGTFDPKRKLGFAPSVTVKDRSTMGFITIKKLNHHLFGIFFPNTLSKSKCETGCEQKKIL